MKLELKERTVDQVSDILRELSYDFARSKLTSTRARRCMSRMILKRVSLIVTTTLRLVYSTNAPIISFLNDVFTPNF